MRVRDRLEILDGLRGVAIVLVVLFHFWQKSWWDPLETVEPLRGLVRRGYLGVEIFFFLSGFCLYWPVVQRGSWAGERPYFMRRALKIFPSYLVCLAAALVLLPEPGTAQAPWLHLGTHISFLHPLFFETYYSVLGVFWSLGVEVQFYLLFPLLARFLVRRSLAVSLGAWGVLALAAWLYRGWGAQQGREGVLYTLQMNQLPGFLELFGGGIACAAMVSTLRARCQPGLAWSALSAVGLGGVAVLIRSFDRVAPGPYAEIEHQVAIRLPLAVALFVTVVGGALSPLRCPAPLRFLATISYNLYLWHTLVGSLLQKVLGITEPWKVTDTGLRVRFTLVAWISALAVSAALTYGLERPLLRGKKPSPRSVRPRGEAGQEGAAVHDSLEEHLAHGEDAIQAPDRVGDSL